MKIFFFHFFSEKRWVSFSSEILSCFIFSSQEDSFEKNVLLFMTFLITWLGFNCASSVIRARRRWLQQRYLHMQQGMQIPLYPMGSPAWECRHTLQTRFDPCALPADRSLTCIIHVYCTRIAPEMVKINFLFLKLIF